MGLIWHTTKAAQEPTRIEFAAKVTATTKGSLPHNGTLCGGKEVEKAERQRELSINL